jgi:hypothetical protein
MASFEVFMHRWILLLGLLALPALVPTQTQEWKQLFDGKDLIGWKHVGPGSLTVEDGLIRTHGGMGLLYWTGGKLGDCVIRVVFKMLDHNDNSGVFIRIPIEPREEWMPVHYGYEVQIDNEAGGEDEYHVTGMLYSLTKPLARTGKPGPEWNTMEITLDGPRTIEVGGFFDDIGVFYLAGGFGRHLKIDAARRIGLIPNLPDSKIVQVGNAAIEGACMALLSETKRQELEQLVRRVEHCRLETHPRFFDFFVDGCQFKPIEQIGAELPTGHCPLPTSPP